MSDCIRLFGKEALTRALRLALGALGIDAEIGPPAAPVAGRAVILYSAQEPLSFFKAVADTEKLGLRGRIIGVCTDPGRSALPRECRTLPPVAGDAFEKAFEIIGPDIGKLVSRLAATPAGDDGELRYYHAIILQSAWSYDLYNLIYREIAHGTKMDFTNTYLAPVSAGLNLAQPDREAYFGELREILCGNAVSCENCPVSCPLKHLHDNLRTRDVKGGLYASEIKDCVDLLYGDPWNHKPRRYRHAIEKLIAISTGIRRQAGISPYEVRGAVGIPNENGPLPVGRGDRSILLIDDHSAYWRPYFSLIAKKLGCRIFFSTDGQNVFSDSGLLDAQSVLPFFDAIILDIVIGDRRNGFDILNEIRRILPNTPVVIASTTHEPDLVDRLQSVNGFIYKKRLVFDKVTALLFSLLTDGRSGKSLSLPNAFFNSNILGIKRNWTLNFTNWAIKHLDGFHAVDDDYFRYFNDHGGRHMISLMGILEQLVKPFLFPEEDLLGISGENREEQILCLYLAVLCHEFGMFPLNTTPGEHSVQIGGGDHIEDYGSGGFCVGPPGDPERKTINISQAIRKFHGQRSMFMIMNGELQNREFRIIFSKLLECLPEGRRDIARCKIAALCGYHNRFMSLKQNDFLRSIGAKELQLESVKGSILGELLNKESFDLLFRGMNDVFGKKNGGGMECENLRRLCAIFRFADALDIDYSRAIPQYLGYGNRKLKSPDDALRNIIENCKRYIVQSVDLNFNDIVIRFNLEQPASFRWPCGSVSHSIEWVQVDDRRSVLTIDGIRISDCDDDRLDEFKKAIDDAAFKRELRNESASEKPDLTKLKNMLCVIVMLEVADEYRAIRDTGLEKFIKFGKAEFSTPAVDFDLLEYSFTIIDKDLK